MSLTQHLDRGRLGDWFDEHADLEGLAADVADAAHRRYTRKPRGGGLDREHYAAVGGVVGQRLADLVEPAPPYPALLGAARAGALSLADAGRLAATYPTHAGLTANEAAEAVHIRPTPDGFWRTLPGARGPEVEGDIPVQRVLEAAADMTTALRVGQLDDPLLEAGRVPTYWVLNLCESVYRAGRIPPELDELSATGAVRAPNPVAADVDDVLTYQDNALAQAVLLAGGKRPADEVPRLGHAAPVFVPGWAEGDLLLGPHEHGGYTLLDVKTVTLVTYERVLGWLQQTLAYALLDHPRDRWRIRRIGLWLPRQDLVVTFPLERVLACLSGHDPVPEFLEMVREAARADGARPDGLTVSPRKINTR